MVRGAKALAVIGVLVVASTFGGGHVEAKKPPDVTTQAWQCDPNFNCWWWDWTCWPSWEPWWLC